MESSKTVGRNKKEVVMIIICALVVGGIIFGLALDALGEYLMRRLSRSEDENTSDIF